MSYDESDEDGEWEVVDIVHTTTSLKPKKAKPAKQEDVDKLAQDIQTQLSLKTSKDTQQMLLLEQKLKQQRQFSEHQLTILQSKLNEITRVQKKQQATQKDLDKQRKELDAKQKQQLLEQQIQIQSLSDHQMLTQKQIQEATQQIHQTQQVTANVNENIQSLQQIQQQQQLQQQLTDQQLQQQLQQQLAEQTQLQTQQQLAQLAQIAAQQQLTQQQTQFPVPQLQNIPQPINFNIPPNQIPQIPQIPQVQNDTNNNNNNNNTNTNNKSWLPSFFVFGKNNANNSNTAVQDMDMGSTPPPTSVRNNNNIMNPEEKEPILMEDDDDDVLKWHNDYGSNPLYNNPQLLKTKAVIGEGKFAPAEKRQCGWILVNKSSNLLKLSAQLECIGGDKQEHGIKVTTEKCYEFSLKPNEEIYILIEVEAPPMIGKYCAFYQLVIDNGVKIGEMLEVMCHVTSQFSGKKEQKIAQIVKMGFNDRKTVVATLQKKKWNVQQTVDTLIGL